MPRFPSTEQVAFLMICCPGLKKMIQDTVTSINCSGCLAKNRSAVKKSTFLLFGNAPAVVKKIMQFHEGKVWVESSPGKGATFWLSFPIKQQDNKK
ncbi:MAG: sensor histidine kinase [Candidatus Electrothrix sp. AUS4]|nr:sensor histidine kinase [Candidatus Electrothrix sp. AUS4]